MKKSLYSLSIATVLTLTSISSQAASDDLVYIAVDPCRIADTRNAGGPLTTTSRNFLVSGTSGELAAQGGTTDCLAPRAGSKPLAISAYVLAIGSVSNGGVLSAYPSDQSPPPAGSGSTLNFAAGQVIGNTTNITLCDDSADTCPSDGEFAILPRNTNQVSVVVDVQGYFYAATGSCPDDMVANGDGCIDKYEASVWSTASGGTQYGLAGASGSDDYPCIDDGSDCGATAANPIYARSVDGVLPSTRITWYQAAQACANAGKRLPTTAEWQMAASGTPAGDGPDCNASPTGVEANTDANPSCISSIGALNMVGNVWEYTADLDNTTIASGGFGSTDALLGVSLGDDFSSSAPGTASTKSIFGVDPTDINGKVGFRCAR